MLYITIKGRPVPKARPRFANGHAYTPAKTTDWEEVVQAEMFKVCRTPLEGPLELSVTFYFKAPKSWPKAKREALKKGWRPWYPHKPDGDNLAKLVKDAGKHILWLDDAQVVDLRARKFYGPEDQTVISLMPVEGS